MNNIKTTGGETMKKEFFYIKSAKTYVISISNLMSVALTDVEMQELMDLVIATENMKHDELEKENQNAKSN